jgi:hypothetical protein
VAQLIAAADAGGALVSLHALAALANVSDSAAATGSK